MYYCFFQEYVRNVKESQPKRRFKDMKWWEKIIIAIMTICDLIIIGGTLFSFVGYSRECSIAICVAIVIVIVIAVLMYCYKNIYNYGEAKGKSRKICECRISALKGTLNDPLFHYSNRSILEWLHEKTICEIKKQDDVKTLFYEIFTALLSIIFLGLKSYINQQLDQYTYLDIKMLIYNGMLLCVMCIILYYSLGQIVEILQVKKRRLNDLKDDLEYLQAEMLSETKNGR